MAKFRGEATSSWLAAVSGRDFEFDAVLPVSGPAIVTAPGGDLAPDYFLNADQRGGVESSTGKVSKTVAQAATQLSRTFASWNDFFGEDQFVGPASTVTFAFRSSEPGTMPDDTGGFSRFNAAQINATLDALQAWSDVANIIFVRAGSGTSGEGAYSDDATMLFANYATGASGAAAFAYYPSLGANGGDMWINSSLSYNAAPVPGNYGQLVLIHELGHAIGFSHPGEYDAAEGVDITYAAHAEYFEDSHQYTVMSYFTENNTGGNFGPSYPATIMLDDIAVAQKVYGANMSTRTGDTVYGFNSNAGRAWFTASSASTILVFAVWDAGGTDTFDFSGYSNTQTIDLNQGAFSSVGTYSGGNLVGNVAIAMGVVIENAIGGGGGDTIVGNTSVNRLTGGGGDDILTGGGGADIFVASAAGGADTVTDFTVGSDRIDLTAFGSYQSIVQSGADTVVTLAAGVSVTLLSVTASTVTTASFIGLSGPADPPDGYNRIDGTGGGETLNGTAASDQIYGGGGADTLNGLGDADWLEGGAGGDVLNGGDGVDTVSYAGSAVGVYVRLFNNSAFGGDAAGDVLSSIENAVGSSNNDDLIGSTGVNRLEGGDGDDLLQGLAGADTLLGGLGTDTLTGGAGGDTLNGGDGIDTISYVGSSLAVYVRLFNNTAFGGDANGDVISNVENAFGSSNNDDLMGSNAANVLTGGLGNDLIRGLGGDDTLIGGVGADTLNGGDGIDTISYVGSSLAVYVRLFNNTVFGGDANGDVISNVENATGSSNNDNLMGGYGDNVLTGGLGADTIQGLAGNDTLIGGIGADTLNGGDGIDTISYLGSALGVYVRLFNNTLFGGDANGDVISNVENATGSSNNDDLMGSNSANTLNGGAGADVLQGLGGADLLTGGTGADRFVFSGASGSDTIADFAAGAGAGDVIQLTGSVFTDFADVLTHTNDDGLGNTVISKSGVVITLTGVLESQLAADDFLFSASSPIPSELKSGALAAFDVKEEIEWSDMAAGPTEPLALFGPDLADLAIDRTSHREAVSDYDWIW